MSDLELECGICLESINKSDEEKVRSVGHDYVCSNCAPEVIPHFERALKSEIYFPPRWGAHEIRFEAFEDLFTPGFSLSYREKVKEYRTPVPKRVYCHHKVSTSKDKAEGEPEADFCNTFLGLEGKGVSLCPTCKGWMCMECRDIAAPKPELHTCDDTKTEGESKAFDPATKGKEWQECPNPACAIKCGLRDGCNAMICHCGVHFCFICGEKTNHDSDHWMQGQACPRWGAVDAPNPMFDTPDPGPFGFQDGAPFPMMLDGRRVLAFPVNEGLYLDADDALKLLEELTSEQHFMEDAQGAVPQVILDMVELLRNLHDNMDWLAAEWTFGNLHPLLRPRFVDPVAEAVEIQNWLVRDELLQARFRETHAAALEITGEDSVLFEMPVMELFERYSNEHKQRHLETVQRFVDAQNAGRTLWVREEDRAHNRDRRVEDQE